MTYLLDTNICIYALKNRPPEVLERLRAVGREAVALSVIPVLELRQGAEKSQQAAANHERLGFFLSPMKILPFDEEAALAGARLRAHLERQGTPIGDLDSLIAAHALARDLILVTNNLREFERVPGSRRKTGLDRESILSNLTHDGRRSHEEKARIDSGPDPGGSLGSLLLGPASLHAWDRHHLPHIAPRVLRIQVCQRLPHLRQALPLAPPGSRLPLGGRLPELGLEASPARGGMK